MSSMYQRFAMFQRGVTLLAGRHLGGPRAFVSHGDDVVTEDVHDAMRYLDEAGPLLALFSYEACVSLDAKSPRKARDRKLGPDVLVRRLSEVERFSFTGNDLDRSARRPKNNAPPKEGAGGGWWGTDLPRPRARARIELTQERARERHLDRVRKAKEHLLDGVLYQANLAHRIALEPATFDDGLAFFLDATRENPPPCAAFVDVPGWGSLISLSPERFVTVDATRQGRIARAYPIKGTRPRSSDPVVDAANLAELCASSKDAAEHVMIVDLLRNDLGKVAKPGGVRVEKLLEVISVKNVHHLESTIAANLDDDVTFGDVIAATIPGGSITGAPKSAAVDVIHELEDGPRGLYTGVLVFVENGVLRSSLLIRSWLRPDEGEGSLHVGGGIIVDSDPELEWQETLDKARALLG
jgi:anthranilate/para-aminobenzoate synthase component I